MTPYKTNGEYLGAEFNWLKARIARLNAEQAARDGLGERHDEPRTLREEEQRLRRDIDACLTVHRKSGGFTLGLDQLDLGPDEKILIIALVAHAISDAVGDDVLAGLGSGASWLSAGDLGRLLDPGDIEGWLRIRPLLTPAGRLRASGVVEVRSAAYDRGARGSLDGYFFISKAAFATVVGQEVEADGAEPG
ncbi:MAG: hypothetical protein FJ125_13945 [Deltaproteobacteria bacterium]|nr:hypothetical protein [Deltaproteobacteria bacterium]